MGSEINQHLNSAQIILLLVSPDSMDSDYCYGIEIKRAVERHERGEARVIPIILRAVYWREAPFGKLQALPKDAKPITSWPDRDEAFFNVVEGIRKAVEELRTRLEASPESEQSQEITQTKASVQTPIQDSPPRQVQKTSEDHASTRGFATGLIDWFRQWSWLVKADKLYGLKRYTEALEAYEQAIRLDPNNADAYCGKGAALDKLKRYTEALGVCEQAIRLDPNLAGAYDTKGTALEGLDRKKEAQQAYEKARQLGVELVGR
jgi:tetratricopeptide (TPR) repeat protein